MDTTATQNSCFCGNTEKPIFFTNGKSNGYEGIYFVIGQQYQGQGGFSPRSDEPDSLQRPPLGENGINRGEPITQQPQLAIVSPVVAIQPSNLSASMSPDSLQQNQKNAPAPPPPPPISANFEDEVDSEEDVPSANDIANAIKAFHLSGKKLRSVNDRVLGPRIKKPKPLCRPEAKAKSSPSKATPNKNAEVGKVPGNGNTHNNIASDSDEDPRSLVMKAVKKRIPAVRGDGKSSDEGEIGHEWDET